MKLTTESTVVNDKKLYTDIENAQTTADEAKVIAGNTDQYFWFTSTGADTGAHISEIKQSEFLASPSGGNLLARSNGIALRDGLTELGIYSADEIRVGETQGQRMSLTSTDMKMYDTGGNQRIRINASEGVIVGREDKLHSKLTNTGFDIIGEDGETSIASYGATARIGAEDSANLKLAPSNGAYPTLTLSNELDPMITLSASPFNNPYSDYDTYGVVSFLSGIASYTVCGMRCEGSKDNGYAEAQFVGSATNRGIASLFGENEDYGAVGISCNVGGAYGSGQILATVPIQVTSDRRLKEHLSYLQDDAIRFIRKLKPAYFNMRGKENVGFYAQDVEEADEWHTLVSNNEDGFKSLNYTGIIAPLVAYCQNLGKRIEELERG